MNPVVILVLSSFLIMAGIMVTVFARRILLMKNGDKVEAKVVSIEKNEVRNRNSDSNSSMIDRYEYLFNVVYSYGNQGYAENLTLNDGAMEEHFPHLINHEGFYYGGGAVIVDNETIPIVVDPKKPTRIIADYIKLTKGAFPEAFGTQNESQNNGNTNPVNPPTPETNQNQNNHNSYHNPYDLSDSNDD